MECGSQGDLDDLEGFYKFEGQEFCEKEES